MLILPLPVAVAAGRSGVILPGHRPRSPAVETMIRLRFPDDGPPIQA